jgi:hypothetical protein
MVKETTGTYKQISRYSDQVSAIQDGQLHGWKVHCSVVGHFLYEECPCKRGVTPT